MSCFKTRCHQNLFIFVNQRGVHLVITSPGLSPSLLSACRQAGLSSETSFSVMFLQAKCVPDLTSSPSASCRETFLSHPVYVGLLLLLGRYCLPPSPLYFFPSKNEIKILRKYTFFCETFNFKNSKNCSQIQLQQKG